MARTDKDRALDALYDLFNVADHIAKCAKTAEHAVRSVRWPEQATASLNDCARSAELFDMRWRDALEALKKLEESSTD